MDQYVTTANENGLAAFASKLLVLELKLLSDPQQTQLVLQPSSPSAWVWDVRNSLLPASQTLAPELDLLRYATFLDGGTTTQTVPSSFSSIALNLIGRQIPDESFGFPVYCASHDQVDLKALAKLASMSYSDGSRIVFTPELVAGLKVPNRTFSGEFAPSTSKSIYHQAIELVTLSTLNPGQERYDQLVLELGLLLAAPGNVKIPTQTEINLKWHRVEAREGVVFEIIVSVMHALSAQGLCNLAEIGHLARQALVSLTFGDDATVKEVLDFWYALAHNPRVGLFTGPGGESGVESTQEDFLLESSLYWLKQTPRGGSKVKKEVDCIAAIAGIAARFEQLPPTELAVRILPRVVAGLQNCDFSELEVPETVSYAGMPQPAFLDPILIIGQLAQGAQKRVRDGSVEPNRAAFELLGAAAKILSVGPSAVTVVPDRSISLTYTPVWAQTHCIAKRLLDFQGQIKPKAHLTLQDVWASFGLSVPDLKDASEMANAVGANDMLRILSPWLGGKVTGYLPPAVLRELADRGCENGTVFTGDDTFVLPVPIGVGQILVTHLPTIRSIFPHSE